MDKKLLILYASAGAGHKKAAEAVFHAAQKESLDVELVDVVDHMSSFFRKVYIDGYTTLISRLTWLWAILYFLSDIPLFSPFNVHFRKFFNAFACRRFIKFLLTHKPDCVISTQFLASELVSYAKEKNKLETKLITVVTDFEVHNFWISKMTDMYCCAADSTKQILIQKGIREDKIKVTGIPVDEKFISLTQKDLYREEFKLRNDLMTVLVMTGGIGVGPIEEIVEVLKDEVQLLVVCGYNKTLYERLLQKAYPNVRIFGFVDYIEKLMSVSQLIVTKAGGLTVTESLVMGLPLIFFFLIPGQEMQNARTIQSWGAGVITKTSSEIKEYVLRFRDNVLELDLYKKRVVNLARPYACQEIISLSKSL